MDRRSFLRLALGAAGTAVLGACTGTDRGAGRSTTTHVPLSRLPPAPRPTVRIPGGDFGLPSPFTYTAGPGYWRTSFLYDTLLWQDSTGEPLPWLARRAESSEDGLTHTFQLREGVRWHDGRPVTAEDVVFSFEYFEAHPSSPLVVARPRYVRSARVTGPLTVEVRLDTPAVTFTESVAAAMPIMPKHVWSPIEDPSAVSDRRLLVGSGPYRLESYSEEHGTYSYTANDDYFLGRPFVRRIEMVPVGNELNALLAGAIDGGGPDVTGVGPDALRPFDADPSFGVIEHKEGFTFPLYWNAARGGALGDVRFRRACAMAIDRRDIVRRLLKGNGTPGNPGFLPPSHPLHSEVEQYGFDLAGAERVLDQAGYRRPGAGRTRRDPDGSPLRFSMIVGNTSPPALAEVVAAALDALGVEVVPEFVDLPRLFVAKAFGNFDLAITLYPGPSGPGPRGDPDYLRAIYSSRAGEFHRVHGYSNPELDELLERQLVTADAEERRRLVTRVQEIAARDLPVLPLYYSTLFFVFKRQVLDQWYFTPGGGFGPGIPMPFNKHLFVTGVKRGLEVRPIKP